MWLPFDFFYVFPPVVSRHMQLKFHFPIAIDCTHQLRWEFRIQLLLTYFFFIMGHEVSRFAPLDPDLVEENELLALLPQLMDELLEKVQHTPQPQCTSILTGRGHVAEIILGNKCSFRNVSRMDKPTFTRLVTLMKGAGLQGRCLQEEDSDRHIDRRTF